MIKSHCIRLYPDKKQEIYLRQSCGVARFVYNWGLGFLSKSYKRGRKNNYLSAKLLFNKIKRRSFPFVMDVSKCVAEYSFVNLQTAFQKLFKKSGGYPRFKKRKHNVGSFSISNDKASVEDNMLQLPKINKIKMAETLRFDGKILKYTISSHADKWFVSISVEIPNDISKTCEKQAYIGIDLGIKDTITLSDSRKFSIPDLSKENKRIRRLQKDLSRKVKGSENWKKNLTDLQNAWMKLTWKRNDSIHKIISQIANEFSIVAMEDLNVSGMMKNHKLARAISNQCFGEIKRQLMYKSEHVFQVDRFFPSSKTCSNCKYVYSELTLAEREWACPQCGTKHDRDVNAAKNILSEAIGKITSVDKNPSVSIGAIGGNKVLVEAETSKYVSSVTQMGAHINTLN
jgi:putative transposase